MKNPKFLNTTQRESIQLLTADANYTILTLNNGQKIMSSYCLNVFANLFDDKNFIRVNRSHLVNKRFIASISLDGLIHLKNNVLLTIPRRRKVILTDQYPNLFNL